MSLIESTEKTQLLDPKNDQTEDRGKKQHKEILCYNRVLILEWKIFIGVIYYITFTTGDEKQASKLATWKGIFSTLANDKRQSVQFHSDSIDEGSETSSLQSFSSFEQRKEWLLQFEANLKNMDYYCENHTTKCKPRTLLLKL